MLKKFPEVLFSISETIARASFSGTPQVGVGDVAALAVDHCGVFAGELRPSWTPSSLEEHRGRFR